MKDSLVGKVVIVTGAGSGIGTATAKDLAANGAKVIISDINDKDGQRVADEITADGGTASFFHTDVSSEESVSSLVNFAVEKYGQLDFAHNNAGMGEPAGPTHELDTAAWDKTFDVDLKGVFLCMKYELRAMLKNGKGAIVNTASGAGERPSPGYPAYVAAKHGVIGLTRHTALEYADQNIRINAIAPGIVDTGIIPDELNTPEARKSIENLVPMKRMAQPLEIAKLVEFLLSDDASYVTGSTVNIDGGMLLTMKDK